MARLCACASALCGRFGGTAAIGGIARPAARAAACAWLRFGAIGRVCRGSAAGVTWTSRTLAAEWAGRYYHTSVVDAAGAIYVLGGWGSGGTYLNDVWASTDRGADRTASRRGRGTPSGLLWGELRAYYGDTKGTTGVL